MRFLILKSSFLSKLGHSSKQILWNCGFQKYFILPLLSAAFDSLWLPSLIGMMSQKCVKIYLQHSCRNDCCVFLSEVRNYQGSCEESQFVLTYLLLSWQGTVKENRTILYCYHATQHPSLGLINLERQLLTHCHFIKNSSRSWEIAKKSLPAADPFQSISARIVMSEDRAELEEVHQAV